ncbi:hypothetical protein C923_03797 [Plasmodium falciparum UGT5.1]|uniref:Uncharacterized protein n=1 Tax=Plasmodium falciparum UGT5.1 TaxID=1237627 RepID=W7JKZ9_PLAFA|nr:hypothetical protein C923_03797 [Plasmodium falciparum UGT5.1]
MCVYFCYNIISIYNIFKNNLKLSTFFLFLDFKQNVCSFAKSLSLKYFLLFSSSFFFFIYIYIYIIVKLNSS